MIDVSMAYERPRTASPVATAALVVALAACRFNFEDRPAADAVDAEPPCMPAVDIAAIDAGQDFMCARLADNSLRCWGANDIGQLGNGTRTSALAAVAPDNVPNVTAFATGYQHACAVRQGDVLCWGRNDIGQLGVGDRMARTVPARVNGLPGDMTAVAAGGLSTCAWNSAGELYCWGQSTGTIQQQSNVPVLVTGVPPIRMVAMTPARLRFSTDFACAVGTDNSLWCWGSNDDYQLGDGTTMERITPVPSGGGLAAASVALGDGHTCARTTTGEVYCWGRNNDGQLGVVGGQTKPTRVDIDAVVELDANRETTCARTSSDEVYCWGDNDTHALGRTGGDAFAPERIDVPPAQALAVASDTSCALGRDGVLRCWGSDRSGLISGAIAPTMTTTIAGVAEVRAAGLTTCVRTTTGSVYCWGNGSLGQLGDGSNQAPTAMPVEVSLPATATKLSVGTNHSCAALASGAVACWGFNEAGEVDGPGAPIRAPTTVAGIPAVVDVAAGGSHTCALAASSTWCWGQNSEGALGFMGGASNPAPPTQSGFGQMSVMDGGGNHTCGITGLGELYCAGRNNESQIGDGGASDAYMPVLLTPMQISSVAAGSLFTCATSLARAELWCWGEPIAGQLGIGFDMTATMPAPVPGFPAMVEVVTGRLHACAREGSGDTVRCWGSNANGQLGDGTLTTVATPTIATALSGATQLAAGDRHTCGLMPDGTVRCVGGNDSGQLGGDAALPSPAPRQAALTCPR